MNIVKGLITSIDFNGNTCVVRLPLFESAANEKELLVTATFATQPGIYNGYKVNDVVYVAFENNEIDSPVVIGKLYLGADKESKDPRGAINAENLKSASPMTLPIDTHLTLDNDEARLTNVKVDGELAGYKTIADFARKLKKQDTKVGALNIQVIDDGKKIGNKVDQRLNNIWTEDSRTVGFGWDINDQRWRVYSSDSSRHASGFEELDILTVDPHGVTIMGDVKIVGYPTATLVLYNQTALNASAPAFTDTRWLEKASEVHPVPAKDNIQYPSADFPIATTERPDGWQTNEPAWDANKLVWQKTITFSYQPEKLEDGRKVVNEYWISTTVCISGSVGPKGDTGRGIESIEYKSSAGKVDTYAIKYTDGSDDDHFDVTNGEDGVGIKNTKLWYRLWGKLEPNPPAKPDFELLAFNADETTFSPDATGNVIVITDPNWGGNVGGDTQYSTHDVNKLTDGSYYIESGGVLTKIDSTNYTTYFSIISTPGQSTAVGGSSTPTESVTGLNNAHAQDTVYYVLNDAATEWADTLPDIIPDTYDLWTSTETIFEDDNHEFSEPTKDAVYRLAQGKSTNYYSDNDPSILHYNVKIGDCWFSPVFKPISSSDPDYPSSQSDYIGKYILKDSLYILITQDNLSEVSEGDIAYKKEKDAYGTNKGSLQQWNGTNWEDISDEIVANKVTASYINALDITARQITVLQDNTDSQSPILFQADGLSTEGKVRLAGFNVRAGELITANSDGTDKALGTGTLLLSSNGLPNKTIDADTLVHTWLITAGNNFGVDDDGKLFAANATFKEFIKFKPKTVFGTEETEEPNELVNPGDTLQISTSFDSYGKFSFTCSMTVDISTVDLTNMKEANINSGSGIIDITDPGWGGGTGGGSGGSSRDPIHVTPWETDLGGL